MEAGRFWKKNDVVGVSNFSEIEGFEKKGFMVKVKFL